MSEENILNARICHRIDSSSNWNNYGTQVPLAGELLVYADNGKVTGIKIGNGTSELNNLDFIQTSNGSSDTDITGSSFNLLWENASTSSSFPSCDIYLKDIDKYDTLLITAVCDKDDNSNEVIAGCIKILSGQKGRISTNTDNLIVTRLISITNKYELSVGKCSYTELSTMATVTNDIDHCIPYRIYGLSKSIVEG